MMKTSIRTKIFTLEEYLNCNYISDRSYELEAGKIIEMPPESYDNVRIAIMLMLLLGQIVGADRISNKAEIIISGSKTNARIPDLTLFSEAGAQELSQLNRSTITLDMLPPILAIEITSPGKANRDRDYRYKRSEYAARGIAHYWIIDPQEQKIVCLRLVDGFYEEEIFDLRQEKFVVTQPVNLEIDLQKLFR